MNEDDVFTERMAYEYNVVRQALASSFQGLARDALDMETYSLPDLKAEIEATMRSIFAGNVHSSLLKVRGYGSPHPMVFAHLAEHLGEPVPAWRLRLLAADAIHTERRTRELRDLGLQILTAEEAGTPTYMLPSLEADLRYAAAYQLRKNAQNSKELDVAERTYIAQVAEATAALPKQEGRG
jgi:hypothetical protein